jgi:hypothetical protein
MRNYTSKVGKENFHFFCHTTIGEKGRNKGHLNRLAINISSKTGTFYKILKKFRFYTGFD